MLINYLKISLRSLMNEKEYALFNILGLAIGLACTLLILLWVQDELKVDHQHENIDDIYRIVASMPNQGEIINVALTPAGLGTALREDFPWIINSSRYKDFGEQLLINNEQKLIVKEGFLADPEFFEIFTHRFIKGDPSDCLRRPKSIVLTKSLANKLFLDVNPLGRDITIKNVGVFTVDGVIEDFEHSHIYAEYIIPFTTLGFMGVYIDDLEAFNYTTYIQVENVPEKKMNAVFAGYYKKKKGEDEVVIKAQALKDIYLHSDYSYDFTLRGDISSVYTFSIIAFIVLTIACINFMNLSTARASRSYMQIGIRKMLGASRAQIFFQYYLHSLIVVLISAGLSVAIVEQGIPLFNNLASKNISFGIFRDFQIFGFVIFISLVAGAIAGVYPALYLASFKSIKIIKGFLAKGDSAALFRKSLVVFQFAISIILIISTIIVEKQLAFLKERKLGYEKDHLVYVEIPQSSKDKYFVIKEKLKKSPDILHVSGMSNLPTYAGPAEKIGKGEKKFFIHYYHVDFDFLKTFDIELVQGKDFETCSWNKGNKFLFNQVAFEKFKPKDILGKKVELNGNKGMICGEFADFNFNTLRHPVEPLVLILSPKKINYLFVRIKENSMQPAIDHMERVWQKIDPDYPLEVNMMNETLDRLYQSEQKLARLFKSFSIVALFLSALGLFGLTSYMTERRRREIGIRKVLGANLSGLIILFAKEFMKWVVLANIIAWPIAYWFMQKWISDFAYRISIHIDVFISSAVIATLIALVTIGARVYVASLKNPTVTLRYE